MNSIITFYSFKGGVGRSMALANIAYLLASEMGKRVLVVDWDLEAQGLEMYFRACPGASIQAAGRGGLIDLLTDAYEGNKPDWHDYVSSVTFGEKKMDLMTSGRQDQDYPARVLAFNWQAFFEKADGGSFIESLRDSWHHEFDLVLIDSRTGFTDAGGVCNVQLPDVLVPVFTTTDESAKGAIDVVERSQRARQKLAYDRSRLLVFPLLSRYDGRTQYVEAKTWLHRFAELFSAQYSDWLPKDITPLQAIEGTKLPYIGYFSFGTKMPAAIEDRSDRESLGYAYYVAATIIANDFHQVERVIADPGGEGQPSRGELALLRMRRALQNEKWEWRTVDALASAAGIGVTEALDVLRGDLSVEFARGKSGKLIARFLGRPQSMPVSPAVTAGRVARVLSAAALTDARTLVMVVAPAPPSDLRSLFSDQPNSIRRAVEEPPELRPNGWGLRTGSVARFVDGEFVQTESFREVINLYRDGQFIVGSRIDRESLAWADNSDSRIHPLALVEFVTNTLTFYRLVLADMRVTPRTVQVELRLGNLTRGGGQTGLPAGRINNVGWATGAKPAPAPAWSRSITLDAETYNPTRAAYLLLREVYIWFGHAEEAVPYTTGTGDDREIDANAIATVT